MSLLQPRPPHIEALSAGTFTIRSSLTAHGRTIEQIQYATEAYVVTVVGASTVLFAPGLHGRYLVNEKPKQLKPVPLPGQVPQPAQVRNLLGNLEIEEESQLREIDGWSCRTIRINNRDARLIVSIESHCARVPGLEKTALSAEREFDAPLQPFHLPLEPDEIVVRSTTRALAADFEQSQTLRLTRIDPGVDSREALDELLRYPVARG